MAFLPAGQGSMPQGPHQMPNGQPMPGGQGGPPQPGQADPKTLSMILQAVQSDPMVLQMVMRVIQMVKEKEAQGQGGGPPPQGGNPGMMSGGRPPGM